MVFVSKTHLVALNDFVTNIVSENVCFQNSEKWLELKVYLYQKSIFDYVKEMHFSSPLHQHSEERGQEVKK